MPKSKQTVLIYTLGTLPKSRVARRTKLQAQIKRANDGRGSRTRGWAAMAPQRGRERSELYRKCGPKCFLMPPNKFPICDAPRMNTGCRINCRGVMAAKIRAAQWKYPVVYARASALYKHRCV